MKLTDDQVAEIKRRRAAGDSPQFLAGDFGVSKRTIHDVVKRGPRKAHGHAKITEEQAREIKSRLAEGDWGWVIAEDLGISEHIVSGIKLGKTWRWL